MSDTKITSMTASGALAGTEAFAAAPNTTTNAKVTATQIKQFVLGTATSSTVGFYGVTNVAQPASSNQAAPTSTAVVSISATQWGFSTSTQGNAVLALLIQIRADLVTLGLLKGAA